MLAFVAGIGVGVGRPSLHPRHPQPFVAAQTDKRDVFYPAVPKPCFPPEYLVLQVAILERPGRTGEIPVALLRPTGRSTQHEFALAEQYLLRHAAAGADVAFVHPIRIHQRFRPPVTEARNVLFAGEPVAEKHARYFQFESRRTRPPELARKICLVRQKLLERFAAPAKSIRVFLRIRPLVHQPIGGYTPPFALSCVFVSLELHEKEGNVVVTLHAPLAFRREPIGRRVLARSVVEHHDVAAVPAQKAVLQQSEQQHSAGAAARKFYDMREFGMPPSAIPEGIGSTGIVPVGPPYPGSDSEFRYRLHREPHSRRGSAPAPFPIERRTGNGAARAHDNRQPLGVKGGTPRTNARWIGGDKTGRGVPSIGQRRAQLGAERRHGGDGAGGEADRQVGEGADKVLWKSVPV